MKIYGLLGKTHASQRVLTVMSPQGASAALAHMQANDDLIVQAASGHLTQYLEKRAGALERLVSEFGIEVLSKSQWDETKRALGEIIWR